MLRALAAAHIVIAILLIPLTLSASFLAPIFLIGPIWSIMLARRLWRRDATAIRALRRTHAIFLVIDAVLIWYGFWMLKAAEESARRGGGLLGGIGVIPIAIGVFLALFSVLTLLLTWRSTRFPP
jgi:hypothetical protein